MLMATKLGRIVTNFERLLSMMLLLSFGHVILGNWQGGHKQWIAFFDKVTKYLNHVAGDELVKGASTYKVTQPFKHAIFWDYMANRKCFISSTRILEATKVSSVVT